MNRSLFHRHFEPARVKPDKASIRHKLAGWPAQLTASDFDQLGQYACSPGNLTEPTDVYQEFDFLHPFLVITTVPDFFSKCIMSWNCKKEMIVDSICDVVVADRVIQRRLSPSVSTRPVHNSSPARLIIPSVSGTSTMESSLSLLYLILFKYVNNNESYHIIMTSSGFALVPPSVAQRHRTEYS